MSLLLANAAKDTYDFLGSPEGELALAQACVHLAAAPKSNAVYTAFGAATQAAKETGSLMPPAHIRNAPTRLMKDLGYGKGYAYDHDTAEGFSGQNYFPDGMERQVFYTPKGEGAEARVKERLDRWAALRAKDESEHAPTSPPRWGGRRRRGEGAAAATSRRAAAHSGLQPSPPEGES